MEPAIQRANELNINTEIHAFSISNRQLLLAIGEEVDLETLTNHELMEIFFIVWDRIKHLNWKDLVSHSINHLPFGLNQIPIVWEGDLPCNDCPDAMLGENHCFHQGECKAWEIFEAHF